MSSTAPFKFDHASKPVQELTFGSDGASAASEPASSPTDQSDSEESPAPGSLSRRVFVVTKQDVELMKALRNPDDYSAEEGLTQDMQECLLEPKDATPSLSQSPVTPRISMVSKKAASRLSKIDELIKPKPSAPTTPTVFKGTPVVDTFKQQIDSYKSQVMVANQKARDAQAETEQSKAKMEEVIEINEDLTRQNLLKDGEIAAAQQRAEEDAESIKKLRQEAESKDKIIQQFREKYESQVMVLDE